MAEFKVPSLPLMAAPPAVPVKEKAKAAKDTAKALDTTEEKDSETPKDEEPVVVEEKETINEEGQKKAIAEKPPAKAKEPPPPIPYEAPPWSGVPPQGSGYAFEVLKGGAIVEEIDLTLKSHIVVGRLENCDVVMEHPSLSRYHAVVQYKADPEADKEDVGGKGFYLYDLRSTHGSYHNKKRVFPHKYYRLRVGHAVRFAGSTRMLILKGPDDDAEEETEQGVTELKKMTEEKGRKARRKAKEDARAELEAREKAEREERQRGIGWGFAEDAVEEGEGEGGEDGNPDMAQNPFSMPENESLYLDDPKKTLRGWFEREGLDQPEYNCQEKGYANFKCTIELPVDQGVTLVAEAEVKGKKKEAVVQCALEACRMLDRKGLLRQSNQESRKKRMEKKWEDDDFYASDDDEFLDRTGNIEKKRKNRMRMVKGDAAAKGEADTFESLTKKQSELEAEVALAERELEAARKSEKAAKASSDGDDLEAYMASLKGGGGLDKASMAKLKAKLAELNRESQRVARLVEITRPTQMPAVKKAEEGAGAGENKAKSRFSGVLVGKRKGGLLKLKQVAMPVSKPKEVKEDLSEKAETVVRNVPEETEEKAVREPSFLEERDESRGIGVDPPLEEAPPSIDEEEERSMRGPQIPDRLKEALQKEAEELPEEAEPGSEPEPEPKEKRGRKDRGRKRKVEKEDEDEDDDADGNGGYANMKDPKYATWTPPVGQSGDGRTSLNDKLGY